MPATRPTRLARLTTAAAALLLMALYPGAVAVANHPANSCVDLEPESDQNPTGTEHTMTATLRTQSGNSCTGSGRDSETGAVTIAADITGPNDPDSGGAAGEPDLTCNIAGNATSCDLSYQGNQTGTDTITAWIDHDKDGVQDSDEPSDSVQKTWNSPPVGDPVHIECDPETATNAKNTSHDITCTVTDAQERPVPGAKVDIEASGTNDPDGSNSQDSPDFQCTTGNDGTCTLTHGPSGTGNTGTTTYTAWIDTDDSNSTVEADLQEGRNERNTPGSSNEPDDTDVVEKKWTDQAPPAEDKECPGFEGDPRNHVVGTPGDDHLVGSPKKDIICGLGGNDTIEGRDGNDLLLGGPGTDILRGGAGGDTLRGGGGSDTLRGGIGDDRLFGGRSNDRLFGGRGRDLLDGGVGVDTCRGGPGRDRRRRCEG